MAVGAALGADLDGRPGSFESSAGSVDRGVDIDPAVVDDQHGGRQAVDPRHAGQHVGDLVGVRRTVGADDHGSNGVAVTGDEERSRRVQQQPIGGAAEVQRLQQTGATRPDHEQVALARQGNARVGFGGEVGDLGEPGFGEHGAVAAASSGAAR